MFALASIATFLLVAVAQAAPIPMRKAEVAPRAKVPSGWATGYLESYDVYHARYDSFSCKTQHGTTFFDECCHPLLSTESVSILPSTCVAPSSSSASVASSASSSADASGEDSCGAVAASPAASSVVVQAAAAVPTTSASTTSRAAPAASAPAANPKSYSGHATYFFQGGNAGACGNFNPDSSHVVALPAALYGNDGGSPSDYCGKTITITRKSNGAQTTAVVADLCPTCTSTYSIDLSVGAFTSIATEEEGQVDVTYSFN